MEEMEWKVISTLNILKIFFCLQIIINYKYIMIKSFRKDAIIHVRCSISDFIKKYIIQNCTQCAILALGHIEILT